MSIRRRLQQGSFSDASHEAVVGIMVVAAEVQKGMTAVCRGQGITPEQYNVLRILRGAGSDGLPRCDVAERLISRAPDVTRLLDRLVKQGLVLRGWSLENRRLSIARITAKGLAVLDVIDPEVAALHRSTTAGLSEADLASLITRLDVLVS